MSINLVVSLSGLTYPCAEDSHFVVEMHNSFVENVVSTERISEGYRNGETCIQIAIVYFCSYTVIVLRTGVERVDITDCPAHTAFFSSQRQQSDGAIEKHNDDYA